ncbi:MAG: hypothetical protein ACYDEV_08020 [Acidiferrobacter sp.]
MKMQYTVFIAAMTLGVSIAVANAAMFGGIDAGAMWDSNFIGAPSGTIPVPVLMGVYSGYFGGYKPFDKKRGAFVASANLQANRLRRYASLDNDVFGGVVGVFHDLGQDASVLATVGGQTVRFSNNVRNLALYMARFHFKEGSQKVWVGETAEYDIAHGQATINTYHGYSATVALNWAPIKSDVLTVSGAHAYDRYNVASASVRTSNAGTLGWLQELGHGVYIRASATREYARVLGGPHFYTTIYATGLGVSF